MYKGKKILVTGASGLIGSSLVRQLLSEGAIVYAMGRSMSKLECVLDKQQTGLHLLQGNVAIKLPEEIENIDMIFHAASPISGKSIYSCPVDTIASNIDGVRNCLEYFKTQRNNGGKNGRMIIFSSATVYGTNYNKDAAVNEDETHFAERLDFPTAAYSEAKRMTEVLAGAYCRQYSVDTVIVRLSYVYGYSKKMPDTAFYEFIKCAIDNRDIVINAEKMARRDNIYIEDAINGILLVAQSGVSGEAYNISSGGSLGSYASASEIAEIIAERANENYGRAVNVKYISGKCQQLPGTILDNAKAAKIGFTVTTSLFEGIEHILEKYISEE